MRAGCSDNRLARAGDGSERNGPEQHSTRVQQIGRQRVGSRHGALRGPREAVIHLTLPPLHSKTNKLAGLPGGRGPVPG